MIFEGDRVAALESRVGRLERHNRLFRGAGVAILLAAGALVAHDLLVLLRGS